MSLNTQAAFRRRIRLKKYSETEVVAGVEDDFHAFKLLLTHDGQKVVGVEGEALRYPLDTCPGSLSLLQQLEGISLSKDPRAIGAFADPRQHCTHLFDLAGLAIAHACRDAQSRQYDICIPDNALSELFLKCDGELILHMSLAEKIIQSPQQYQGQSIEQGFSAWVQQNISDQEEREAALVLQRGRFVSMGRLQKAAIVKTTVPWRHVPIGVCYSYQADIIDKATRVKGSIKDCSDPGIELVKFV